MAQDAFSQGVEPGGLWNKNDIRILLCYILSSVNAPLSGEDVSQIVQRKALANYFEVGDALAALLEQGHVCRDGAGLYTVTDTGREIADRLDSTLPLSVRDKALEAAVRLMAEARSRRENRVEVREMDRGFQVTCHVSGGMVDLMAISLYVPDRAQAEMVERHFHRDPDGVYGLLLAALTGDNAYAEAFFEEHGGED